MGSLGYRFMNFMRGRYGWDQFGMFLMIASFVIELLGRILRSRWIYYIGLALFVYMIWRMLSRNIAARVGENQKFINGRNRFANWRYFRQQRRQAAQQKANGTYTYSQAERARGNRRAGRSGGAVYCYYYCPSCKQQVRVPAGQGKVRITCPRCQNKFETYS